MFLAENKTFIFQNSIIPHLTAELKAQVLKEAFDIANQIKDKSDYLRALSAIIPHLNTDDKPQTLKNILDIAEKIKNEQEIPYILSEIAPYLTDDAQLQTLLIVRQMTSESDRIDILSALLPYLNDELKEHTLQYALDMMRNMTWESNRIKALSAFIPHITKRLTKIRYLHEALSIASEITKRRSGVYKLSYLAPYLTNDLKAKVKQNALSDLQYGDENTQSLGRSTLLSLAPYLDRGIQINLLSELVFTLEIHSLNDLFKAWERIEFEGLKESILLFVKFISQKNRKDGVQVVGILTPALVHFSGEEIVPELYRAIQDTARWWP